MQNKVQLSHPSSGTGHTYNKMMPCGVYSGTTTQSFPLHGGCGSCYPQCRAIPQKSASFGYPPSSKPCCNLGFANRELDHVLSMQKGSRYSFDRSSTMQMSGHNSSDFLRPFLTREEYIYWNSHFNHIKPSCACPVCTNPRDPSTPMNYQYRNPPVPIPASTDITSSDGVPTTGLRVAARPNSDPAVTGRPNTGFPVTGRPNSSFPVAGRPNTGFPVTGRPNSGFSACHSNGFGGCFCSQTKQKELVPAYCVPEKSALKNNGRRMNANYPDSRCATRLVSKRSASEYNFRSKRFVEKSSPSKKGVPPPSQIGSNYQNRFPKSHSTKSSDVHKEVTSKSLRNRLSQQYLCGDKSFDEIPANPTSKTSSGEKNSKTGSPPVLCDSTSSCGLHPEAKLTGSCQVKRKSATEQDLYPQRKHPARVDNKVSSHHATQKLNETIDLNDCWKQFIGGSFPVNDYEPGSKTSTEAQPIGMDQAFGVCDAAQMLHALEGSDQTPNDGGKCLEHKGVDKIFKTPVKPVQRKLLNDIGNSPSYGYALDHDCLPKVVGVLSSNFATAVSGFRKQVR